MPGQPPVLVGQQQLGELLRDAGMARADLHATSPYWQRVDATIEQKARLGVPFTSEDVRLEVGDPPDHPNAMGARFNAAARRGLIAQVGYRKAERASLHRHPLAVWVGGKAAVKAAAS